MTVLYYVTNQQIHVDKICFIIYCYSPTCFGRFCDHHQGVIQEYRQYKNNCTKSIIKTTRCYSKYFKRSLWPRNVEIRF